MSPLRFRYQTIEFGDIDIHIRTLRDNQQFYDPEGIAESLGINSTLWPIFGIVWPSSVVLANHVLSVDFTNQRVLEVGCGIGLSSLLLNHLNTDITATDYHPEVETYLSLNAKLNNDKNIPFIQSNWNTDNQQLGKFDTILGSDLLYEDEHIALLARFINHHAKDNCRVVLVDPGRKRHAKFSKQMEQLGFEFTKTRPDTSGYLDTVFKGYLLQYSRVQH